MFPEEGSGGGFWKEACRGGTVGVRAGVALQSGGLGSQGRGWQDGGVGEREKRQGASRKGVWGGRKRRKRMEPGSGGLGKGKAEPPRKSRKEERATGWKRDQRRKRNKVAKGEGRARGTHGWQGTQCLTF